jgi:hypothetical protein
VAPGHSDLSHDNFVEEHCEVFSHAVYAAGLSRKDQAHLLWRCLEEAPEPAGGMAALYLSKIGGKGDQRRLFRALYRAVARHHRVTTGVGLVYHKTPRAIRALEKLQRKREVPPWFVDAARVLQRESPFSSPIERCARQLGDPQFLDLTHLHSLELFADLLLARGTPGAWADLEHVALCYGHLPQVERYFSERHLGIGRKLGQETG